MSRSLVTTRHRCAIIHEVDAYKDKFPTIRQLLQEIKVNVKSCNAQIDESLLGNMSLSTECAEALLSFRYAGIIQHIYERSHPCHQNSSLLVYAGDTQTFYAHKESAKIEKNHQ